MTIAFDTETALIAPGLLAPPMTCLTWKRRETSQQGILGYRDAVDFFAEVIHSDEHVVGHNLPFDIGVFLAEVGRTKPQWYKALLRRVFERYEQGSFHDTIIRQQLMDIATGNRKFVTEDMPDGESVIAKTSYSLDALAKRHLRRVLDKSTWRLQYGTLREVPISQWPQGAIDYAMTDAVVTMDIYGIQSDLVRGEYEQDEFNVVNEPDQNRAQFALHLLSMWGIRTDPEAVKLLGSKLHAESNASRVKLAPSGIYRPDGTKNMKVLRALVRDAYQRKGMDPPMTSGGATRPPDVSTSEEALRGSGDPMLILLAESMGTEKLLSSFLPVLEAGNNGPINPSYHTLVETGRTASFKPNIQQPPRKGGIRECFVARPGRVFCSVDFNAAELCGLAQVTIDFGFTHRELADAINAGMDPHLRMASKMLGLEYDDAKAQMKVEEAAMKAGTLVAGPETTPVTDRRQLSKIANFGYPGGLGAATFVQYAAGYGVEITEEKSTELREDWKAAWPEMKEYFQLINRLMDMGSCASQITQVRSNRIRGLVRYTAAANGFFQGLIADAAKSALWAVVRECFLEHLGSPLYGSRPSLFLHDEVIAELPETRATEAAERMSVVMNEAAQKWMPDVKVSSEPALCKRWYKNAKLVRAPDGRMLPWEPEKPKAAA